MKVHVQRRVHDSVEQARVVFREEWGAETYTPWMNLPGAAANGSET
jgi:hypothetical protein